MIALTIILIIAMVGAGFAMLALVACIDQINDKLEKIQKGIHEGIKEDKS